MDKTKIDQLEKRLNTAREQGQATVEKAREQGRSKIAEICDVGVRLIMQKEDHQEAPPPPTDETCNQIYALYQEIEEEELGRMLRTFVGHLRAIEKQAGMLSGSVPLPQPPDPAFEEAMSTIERIDNVLGPATEARWFVENAGLNI